MPQSKYVAPDKWNEKMDAVIEQQRGGYKHPDCEAEGCANQLHHGHPCRGMCEKREDF